MKTNYQLLVAAIAAACCTSIADAEENLKGSIENLQELKLEGDFRRSDLSQECEGLLGVRYNALFFEYATSQMQEENIPNELKELHAHDDDEDFADNNEFNPMEYAGMFGDEIQEVMEMLV